MPHLCVCSTESNSLWPHGLYPTRLPCPWGLSRTLEWAAFPSSRGSSLPRGQIWVSCISCTGGGFFTASTSWETPTLLFIWHPKNIPHTSLNPERSTSLIKTCVMMGRLFNFFCSNSSNERGLYDFQKKKIIYSSGSREFRLGSGNMLQK